MGIKDPAKRFSLFCVRAKELRESQFVKEGSAIGFTLKWDDSTKCLRAIEKEINMTNLKAYLVTFRQFFSKKEPIYIFGIYDLCQKHITDEKYRGWLIKSREFLEKALRLSGVQIIQNNKEISAEEIMKLIINGVIFHSDEKKIKKLGAVPPVVRAFYTFNFLNVILDAANQLYYVENTIRTSIREGSMKL